MLPPAITIGGVRESAAEMVFQEYPVFVYSDAECCPACGRVTDDAGVVVPAGSPAVVFDIAETLDGAVLASDSFRELCADVDGINFRPIPDLAGYHLISFETSVELDRFQSHVRIGTACGQCDLPRYVTRDGPMHLRPGVRLPNGFSATDIRFGDTADFGEQPIRLRPHVLVDPTTRAVLKGSDLLGIHFVVQPWSALPE